MLEPERSRSTKACYSRTKPILVVPSKLDFVSRYLLVAIPMVVGKNHPAQITRNIFPTDKKDYVKEKGYAKACLSSKITVHNPLQVPEILKKIESAFLCGACLSICPVCLNSIHFHLSTTFPIGKINPNNFRESPNWLPILSKVILCTSINRDNQTIEENHNGRGLR